MNQYGLVARLRPEGGPLAMTKTIGVAAALSFLGLVGCASAPPPQAAKAAIAPRPPPSCRIMGEPFVVAPNVYLGDVYAATRKDGGFDVVVLDGVDPCLSVGIDLAGDHLGTTLVKCPQGLGDGRSSASNGTATYVARETQDRGHDALALGVVTYTDGSSLAGVSYPAQQRVVEHLMVPGTHESMRDPVLASYGGDGFALAWVQGHKIRVQPIEGWAQLVGTAVDVSPPTTGELGPPALVFDGHGGGLVAFAAPSEHGLDVVATPIACTN
jgi:hypothetical protein